MYDDRESCNCQKLHVGEARSMYYDHGEDGNRNGMKSLGTSREKTPGASEVLTQNFPEELVINQLLI